MKISAAIKKWYRGKPTPPLKLFIGLDPLTRKQVEVEQKDKYVQPPIAKLIVFALKLTRVIISFYRREWRCIIPIIIALASLFIALLALFTNDRFIKLITR